jgi:hypothetical protein
VESYKLKLFLDSFCFHEYTHNIEGTLHDPCGYVSFVIAGVTPLSCYGFQWFLHGESAELVQK